MRKSSFIIFLMGMIMVAMFVLIGFSKSSNAQSTSKEPIKIGYVGTLSGPFAAVEPYQTPAIQMVIDDINAKGGLLGRKVELVSRDNQGDPSIVRQKLDELKAAGCVVMLGCILDPCCPPMSQWATDNKIPIIIPASANFAMRINGFSKYAFITGPAAPALAKVLVKSLAKQDIKSIYSIGADSDICHDVFKFFWAAMKKAKPNTKDLGTAMTGISEMEFSNIISAALAKKPDLILLGVAGPPYVNFVQQARRFNLYQKTKIAAGAYLLGAECTSPFGKDYPAGTMCNTYCPFNLDEQPMKDFTNAHLARTKLYPADITMEWHIAALAAVEAIKKANSTEPDKMVNALETMSFDTPVGKVRYRDFDHQAMLPIYFATAGYSKDYPIAVGLNPVKYGEEVYPTKEEIMALRAAK
jgi:branched-chain amino acid transport system substrate-binding protein